MYWARDRHGSDIPAWQGGLSATGLSCPTCGEPVRRRAGPERSPHFAHFNFRAKPECENYFPSNGYCSDLGDAGIRAYDIRPDRSSLTCGLFLEDSDRRGMLNLWLRTPSVELDSSQMGSLIIETGIGHRSYEAGDLSCSRLIPLRPQIPLGKCRGSGILQRLAERISVELGIFINGKNLFYATERGGRLVFPNEPLEWGVSYRLLSNTPIESPSNLREFLGWTIRPMLAEWFAYEFSLATMFKSEAPAQVSEFLGKRIRTSRPHLHLMNPMPHHIESDGTYVYPVAPPTLLIKRSAPKSIQVTGSPEATDCVITELSEEWVQLEKIPTGESDCIVSIDGDEQVVFRIETCELFRPAGARVHCGEHCWDLVSDPSVDKAELFRQEISIECDSEKVLAHIAKRNPDWKHAALGLIRPANAEKILRAGSFGRLLAAEEFAQIPVVSENGAMVQDSSSAGTVWIEALVAATLGDEGLGYVKKYLADPMRSNVHHLGPLIGSHLMPYIRAAHDRVHGG